MDSLKDALPRRRVLVVDDNVDSARTLAMLLDFKGQETRTVHSGPAALKMAQEMQPHVVLLDLGMPEMDGFEVARKLRQQPDGQAMLLVALTGLDQEEDCQRTQQAGFDLHLVKPIDFATLEKLLLHPKVAGSAG